jgi:protein-S-isoprenylcysteine O-methyltransferase Ste14
MIDRLRYLLGVLCIITLLPGLLFWFIIHPLARRWRRLGPMQTYLIVLPVLIAFGVLLFQFSESILGADLGTNWMFVAIALVCYGVTIWIEFQYRKHLSIATLVGVQELQSAEKQNGKLLKDGIYGVVRHPRYLSAGIGVFANAIIANYVGLYILILFLFSAGYMMLLLEERELVERFGEEYRCYQREVPRIIPRLRKPM